VFENTDLKEQRAATTRQGIIRMLACCGEMLQEEISLSRQTSVSDFFKSSSGIRASPPKLLDIGDDCPDGLTTVHEEAISP
jgi:hypothetical protein